MKEGVGGGGWGEVGRVGEGWRIDGRGRDGFGKKICPKTFTDIRMTLTFNFEDWKNVPCANRKWGGERKNERNVMRTRRKQKFNI